MKLPNPLTSRVVLVGTSQYNHLPPLPAVANNLRTIGKLLSTDDLWGLPSQHCITVHNPSHPDEILDPLWAAAEEARDTLIIYYAGHGQIYGNESELHLTLVNSERGRDYKAVRYEYVRAALRHSRARCRIAILDCCYSGRALGTLNGSDDATETLANSADLGGTYLMAASGENRTASAEGAESYTAFTGELIRVIRDGIPDQPEHLELEAIFRCARDALRDKNLPIPQSRGSDYAGNVALFRNRAHSSHQVDTFTENYGAIPGISIGTLFPNRQALHDAGVHRPLQAGICGTARRGGAESIVVSGGYKDDEDYGEVIIYTGHGGRDPDSRTQVRDQSPEDPGNAALIKSITTQLPVRVIRGSRGDSRFSPEAGFSYDGLFLVKEYWLKPSHDGPIVLQFRLEQFGDRDEQRHRYRRGRELASGRWEQVAPGIYSDRHLANDLKQLYSYACQICETVLEIPGGIRFASVAHIRGLELPHSGPDTLSNMLCLCPNHQALFKFGSITIEDDLRVIDQTDGEEIGVLLVRHDIDLEHIRYHREHHKFGHQKLRDQLS